MFQNKNIVTKPFNENEGTEKLKKAVYRDELMAQMELNRSKLHSFSIFLVSKVDRLRLRAAEEELEEHKLKQERNNINTRLD